jgi:hypothetical protein
MRNVTFRIIRFESVNRFIGVAWNYEIGALISTRDHATYTEARAALDIAAAETNVTLRWFDGNYVCPKGSELLIPDSV